jgi:hypothetical protein
MRNHSTGSPWPVSNNPAAKFNDPNSPECNLKIPVWQLVRASTAAPVYFPPETIEIGGKRHVFVDGGITPYNNPALLLFYMATLPAYNVEWETGVDKMLLVSIGTGRIPSGIGSRRGDQMSMLYHAQTIPIALMDSISLQQDMVCRTIGFCKEGEQIDSEIGNLRDVSDAGISERKFTYVRYDHAYKPDEIESARRYGKGGLTLDNVSLIPFLRDVGANYAERHVRADDLV